jgi:hypothetical protein
LIEQNTMALVIGTDEAGYAPNLGPLVVAATAWRVPNWDLDFYAELKEHVHHEAASDDPRLVIADSKTVYRSGGSIDRLEASVLALLSTYAKLPQRITDLLRHVCSSDEVSIPAWYAWPDTRLPLAANLEELRQQGQRLSDGFGKKSIRLERIAARLVFPKEFNELLILHGNKASALSAITLQLAHDLAEGHADDCLIVCDRHGGRARYAPLVQQYLTELWPRVVEETSTSSRYSWSEDDRDFEVRFVVNGERFLPTAAASMTAKYLREVMMQGWNGFWQRHDTELQPTAGYPGDAKRFLRDVEPILQRLGIGTESIWRVK